MPTRPRRSTVAGNVGAENEGSLCINGINLAEQIVPEHNEFMEAYLTGELNPFISGGRKEFIIIDSQARLFTHRRVRCHYTALWNLAVSGINSGENPRSICSNLRCLWHYTTEAIQSDMLVDLLLPRYRRAYASQQTDTYTEQENARPLVVNPAVTPRVIETLAEEGILERDACEAVTRLIENGTLRPSLFREGSPLFIYGDDRRHVVSRILNYIRMRQEREENAARERNRRLNENSDSQTHTHNPMMDMLTGRPLGYWHIG